MTSFRDRIQQTGVTGLDGIAIVWLVLVLGFFAVDQARAQPVEDRLLHFWAIGPEESSWSFALYMSKDVRFDQTADASLTLFRGENGPIGALVWENPNAPVREEIIAARPVGANLTLETLSEASACMQVSAAAFTVHPEGQQCLALAADGDTGRYGGWTLTPSGSASGDQRTIWTIDVVSADGATLASEQVSTGIDVTKPFLDRYPWVFTGVVALLGVVVTFTVGLVKPVIDKRAG